MLEDRFKRETECLRGSWLLGLLKKPICLLQLQAPHTLLFVRRLSLLGCAMHTTDLTTTININPLLIESDFAVEDETVYW